MTRVLLCTGKGGVGKTSVAAATAVRAARRGARVLVSSTDPAHSLADVLDTPLGDVPRDVPGLDGRLRGQQIDAQQRLEQHWGRVRDYLAGLLTWGGASRIEAEELMLLPGLEELFALVDLRERVDDGEHDLVVVDCAPTAETLRMLALPDALGFYVQRWLPPGRQLARAVRPLTRGAAQPPVPGDDVFGALERLHADLSAVHALLQDPARASVRLVCAPERPVVAETERMATQLGLFGYAVDAVVVNRVLPDAVDDPYLSGVKARQRMQLEAVETAFAPLPILTGPLQADELVGAKPLEALATAVYGERDEQGPLHDARPVELTDDGDDRLLRLALPFAEKGEVDLARRGAELHVRVGTAKRVMSLPAALQRREVVSARLEEGGLEIRFATPSVGEAS